MEFESIDEGHRRQDPRARGSEGVKVGTVIAVLAGDGEDASRLPLPAAPGGAVPDPAMPSRRTNRGPRRRRRRRARQARVRRAARADPDIPAGTNMVKLTVREALRDAMAEEMRRDDRVFVIGEEVAEYQGAYKVTQGLLEEFGPGPGDRHPDHRVRLRRHRHRRGDGRPPARWSSS
jgi:pyruvate dehydrogenase E1 component beta subunit